MKAIASLSENGWITDSAKILDRAVSYYILSDGGQSLVFKDSVINLPHTYYLYINEPELMAAQVKSDLDSLLSRYFNMVEVETSVKHMEESRYGILMYVSVLSDDAIKLELTKVAELNTSGLKKITDISNYGSGISYLNALG